MATIVIADDHELFRIGLKSMLGNHRDWVICGEVSNGSAIIPVVRESRPDLLIIDTSISGCICADVIRGVRELSGAPEVLLLERANTSRSICEGLEAGARGYLHKSDSQQYLIDAVKSLLNHDAYYSDSVILNVIHHSTSRKDAPGDEPLSAYEQSRIRHVIQEMTMEIAPRA